MPLMDRVGSSQSSAVLQLALAVLVGACLVVGWLWASREGPAERRRERLRELVWAVALVVVAALLIVTGWPVLAGNNLRWWLLMVVLVVAVVLVVRPALAAGVVPASLIILGLWGIWAAHMPFVITYVFRGPVRLGEIAVWFHAVRILLPLVAYALLLLGGWLAWRELNRHPAAAQRVLGRMAALRPGQQWGMLLLPVVIIAAGLVRSDAWLVLTLALSAVSMLAIRLSPGTAARLATAGLIAVSVAGFLLAKPWFAGGRLSLLQGFPGGRLYGAVDVYSAATASAAAVEALALLGLGCWVAPRAFPGLRSLLGLASEAELSERVERLTESRAVAVDTASADLRRLERDLHDGAQARLVALGMNLRAAERLIPTSPTAAAALVAEARETSARALTELRELVRGVLPPVLADRGLPDAIRALALDSPLHVQTDIDLPGRLPRPVETACYFAVAELLTNAAKHSGARDARVAMSHSGRLLRIEVTDFGLGGADPARGSGLAGVEKRLAAFDGILAVSSPAGGPTIVVLEVPCALSSPKTSSC
jgi:signal transduction histidine kinase